MADTQKTYETPYDKKRKLLLHVIALYHHQTNLNILIAQYAEEEKKKMKCTEMLEDGGPDRGSCQQEERTREPMPT